MKTMIRFGLVLFLIAVFSGIAFAGVTRSIGTFNCPSNTRIDFAITNGGTFTGISEYVPNSWAYVSSSPVATVVPYGSDDMYRFGITSGVSSAYYVVDTRNQNDLNDLDYAFNNNPHLITKGEYSTDGASPPSAITGPSSFSVRKDRCQGGGAGYYLGAYDDEDSDGWGAGCACPGPDCNDQDANINPGHAELWCNNIDDNCDNRECCSQQQYAENNPRYYDGTGADADGAWESGDSNYHVCNGLDNTEKGKFMNRWLNAEFDAALNVVGNNVPTDYNNP